MSGTSSFFDPFCVDHGNPSSLLRNSRAQAGPSKTARRASDASSVSASSLIDDLDEAAEQDDFDWKGLRERRLEAIKAEVKRNEASKDDRHGRLTEVTNEKELISTSA